MKEQLYAYVKLWLAKLKEKPNLAAILGVLAMVLIFISELWPAPDTKTEAAIAEQSDMLVYQEQLEQRLSGLIEQIDGAGKTAVMVTLESGEETVYALDTQAGQTQSEQTHVLLDDGTALAQTVYLPTVCGVAVVCDGGGDIRVAARITELVCALLDVPSNHVCIEKRSG